jgi:hypothetical protein
VFRIKALKKAMKASVVLCFPTENGGQRLEAAMGSGKRMNFPPELHF